MLTPSRATAAPAGRGQSSPANSLKKRCAATIGPMVCELDGPMPILNRSKTERNKIVLRREISTRVLTGSSDIFAQNAIRQPTSSALSATLDVPGADPPSVRAGRRHGRRRSGSRQRLVDLAGQPIGDEADPFVQGADGLAERVGLVVAQDVEALVARRAVVG